MHFHIDWDRMTQLPVHATAVHYFRTTYHLTNQGSEPTDPLRGYSTTHFARFGNNATVDCSGSGVGDVNPDLEIAFSAIMITTDH